MACSPLCRRSRLSRLRSPPTPARASRRPRRRSPSKGATTTSCSSASTGNWGVREGATAVIGYRWAKVKDNERVTGGLVDLTFALTGAPVGLGEVHVKALQGRRSVQGELGVGYGFQGEAFLLNGGGSRTVRQRRHRLPVRQGLAAVRRNRHARTHQGAERDDHEHLPDRLQPGERGLRPDRLA